MLPVYKRTTAKDARKLRINENKPCSISQETTRVCWLVYWNPDREEWIRVLEGSFYYGLGQDKLLLKVTGNKTDLFQESGNTYDSFMFNKIINKQIRMSYDRINDLGQKANFNQPNLP